MPIACCRDVEESQRREQASDNIETNTTPSSKNIYNIFDRLDAVFGGCALSSVSNPKQWETEGACVYKRQELTDVQGGTKIYGGITATGENISVIRTKLNEPVEKSLITELENWRKLTYHPNVAKILHASIVRQRYVVFVVESCSYTLEECINKKTYPLPKQRILKSIAAGLSFLHSKQFVHGHLKPSSVIIQGTEDADSKIKLSDFMLQHTQQSIREHVFWTTPETVHSKDFKDVCASHLVCV